MPEDIKKRQQYEHEAQVRKEAREEARADEEVNAAVLRGDQHTGEQGLLREDGDSQDASLNKEIYNVLPDFTKDELRRIRIVPRGQRLKQGGTYVDIRFREAGALTAHGEEEVHDEMLVFKNDVDYEIWDKLLGKTERLSTNTP